MTERLLAPPRWTPFMMTASMSPHERAAWDESILKLRGKRPDRLSQYIAGLPRFDWQAFNCCHFAAGWVVANGRPDPMAGLRAMPTMRAARRLVRELGGIVAACSKALGREPIPATFAMVGDIVHFDLTGGGFTLGICNGRQAVCIDEAGAFAWLPMSDASCAWRLE